jgi:hypothetical protein
MDDEKTGCSSPTPAVPIQADDQKREKANMHKTFIFLLFLNSLGLVKGRAKSNF